jgi:hypothetical protein
MHGYTSEHRLHVRRHVVGTFHIMRPSGLCWREAIEGSCQVTKHFRIRIFLDDERCGCMTDENEQCAFLDAEIGDEAPYLAGDLDEIPAARIDNKGCGCDQLRRGARNFRQMSGHDGFLAVTVMSFSECPFAA